MGTLTRKKILAKGHGREAFTPELKGAIEGWVVRQLTLKWRPWQYQPDYEWDDIMQEAALLFCQLKQRYEGQVDNGAWFMSLYKTSFYNMMVDITKGVQKRKHTSFSLLVGEDDEGVEYDVTGELDNYGAILSSMSFGDSYGQRLMEKILESEELTRLFLETTSRVSSRSDSSSKALALALGVGSEEDVVSIVASSFATV